MDRVTAVILAGGKSSRMGRDKLTMTLGGETLLARAVRRFSGAFLRVTVSVSGADRFPEYGDMRIFDIHPGLGPISGLHAALSGAGRDGVFLVAADMPYANPDAAKELVYRVRGYDACAVRHTDGKVEPLFAYYGAAALGECESLIQSRRYNISRLFERLRTLYIAPEELGDLWTDELSLNVNNPDDYEKIQKLGPHA